MDTQKLTNTHIRQQALNLTIPETVHIIGVGGVGSWLAYFLGLAGVPNLWLWDTDVVSESNLNRLPLGPSTLGQLKTDAMASLIHNNCVGCTVTSLGLWNLTIAKATNLRPDWIVACTDTHQSRLDIYQWARSIRGNYIELSAEGEFGGVTGTPAAFSTPAEKDPGYASVPVWVGPCVFAASMAAAYILHNEPLDSRVHRAGFSLDPHFTPSPILTMRKSMTYYDSDTPIPPKPPLPTAAEASAIMNAALSDVTLENEE